MKRLGIHFCFLLVIILGTNLSNGQFPPRLQIPGAFQVQDAQPNPVLRQRIQQITASPAPRVRGRFPQNAIPIPVREVRPVVEEPEEEPAQQIHTSSFDDEVARLGLSGLQNVLQQSEEETERPVAFRPERPLPVLRENIREIPARPLPVRQETPRPVIRQELKQEVLYTRPTPVRQEIPEAPVQHVRRPAPSPPPQPQPVRASVPQPVRHAPTRIASRPAPQYLDEDEHPQRARKPPVQILRKYRTDNADGSITWGYENEDGSFKEETIGIDCITRGKYGYVDPDGVKREYTYETGGTCEEPEEELEDLPPQQLQAKGKKPSRLPPPQYIN